MAQAPGVDISSLLREYEATAATRRNVVGKTETAEKELDTSITTEKTAIKQDASLAAQIIEMIDSLTLQKEQRNAQAATIFGTNPEVSNFVIEKFAGELATRHSELQQRQAGIKAKQDTGFWDNPLDWIYNQFALPSDINAYNTAAAQYNTLDSHLKNLQDQTQEQVATNNAIAATTSSAVIANQSNSILQRAIVEAEKANQRALSQGVQFANVRLAATHQQFQEVVALQGAQIAVQRLQIDRAQLGMAQERQVEWKKELERKQGEREFMQEALDKLTQTVGLSRISVDQYNKMTGKQKNAITFLLENPDIQEGRLGSNIFEALRVSNSVPMALTPGLNTVKDRLSDWLAGIQDPLKNPAIAGMNPEKKSEFIAKEFKKRIDDERRVILDTGSIFSPAPLKAVGAIPVVAQTEIWKQVMSALDKNPMAATSSQQIYDTAVSLVAQKKLSVEQAAVEVSTIFTAIIADNNTQRQYQRLAIIPQTDFTANLKITTGFIGEKRPVQLNKEVTVKNAILRSLYADQPGVKFNPILRGISGLEQLTGPIAGTK